METKAERNEIDLFSSLPRSIPIGFGYSRFIFDRVASWCYCSAGKLPPLIYGEYQAYAQFSKFAIEELIRMHIPNSPVRTRIRIGSQCWALAALIVFFSVSGSFAADVPQTKAINNSKAFPNIPERISFDYLSEVKSYSVSSSHLPFTLSVVTLPPSDANTTHVTISITFRLEGFDVTSVRLKATTAQGQSIEPAKFSVVTVVGKGDQWPTSTFDAEFATKPGSLSRLIVQHRSRENNSAENPKVENHSVKSLELVTSQKEDDQYTPWGNVSDLDGDCEFDIKDKTLTMAVPPGCHDLAPGQPLNAPFVLNQISGDFTAQVKIVGKFVPGKLPQKQPVAYNGAGILIWENDDHYLRIERNAYWSRGDGLLRCDAPLMEYWKDRRYQGHNLADDKVIADFIRGQTLWLRLTRTSKEMTVSISHEGTEWDVVKSFETDLPNELFLGLAGLNTSNDLFLVTFEQFTLVADRLIAPAHLTPDKSAKN